MENKKIKGATPLKYDNIQFKSKLEVESYKILKSEGFKPEYEQYAFHLWEGKKFAVPCYDMHKDRKLHKNVWGRNDYKPVDIRYRPDFVFFINTPEEVKTMIVVECKGYQNDRYPYVKKLFLSYLEENVPQSIFFEVHNQKQLKAAVEVIKNISNEEKFK